MRGRCGKMEPMELEFLEAMGFYSSAEQTYRLVMDAPVESVGASDNFNRVSVYKDPSGVSICFMESLPGQTTESFAVTGATPVSVAAWQVTPGLVWADVFDKAGVLQTRLLVSVDDPHRYPLYSLQSVGAPVRCDSFQLGAIASDVTVYPSVEDWAAHQTPIKKEDTHLKDDPSVPDEVLIGPKFIGCPWIGMLQAGQVAPADLGPQALFKGLVEEVTVAQNKLTGRPWYKVAADCGVPTMVALPADISPRPQVGGVIDGQVFMTGTSGFWAKDE